MPFIFVSMIIKCNFPGRCLVVFERLSLSLLLWPYFSFTYLLFSVYNINIDCVFRFWLFFLLSLLFLLTPVELLADASVFYIIVVWFGIQFPPFRYFCNKGMWKNETGILDDSNPILFFYIIDEFGKFLYSIFLWIYYVGLCVALRNTILPG